MGLDVEEDLVNDGWTDIFKSLGDLMDDSGNSDLTDEELNQLGEIIDFKREEVLFDDGAETKLLARRERSVGVEAFGVQLRVIFPRQIFSESRKRFDCPIKSI